MNVVGVGMGWIGLLMMLFIWALIIVGVVALVTWLVRGSQGGQAGGTSGVNRPLEILKERYARGEISREEYERMRQDLQ